MTENEQAALIDGLVTWGDKRILFMGGKPPAMVVYAPLMPVTLDQRRSLTRLLQATPRVVSCQLAMAEPRDLKERRRHYACIEAVSQAQRFLAERMVEAADQLSGLASTDIGRGSDPDG